MSSRHYATITPVNAAIIKAVAESSLHRLPIEETCENLMGILDAYIMSNGQDTQAHTYLKRSSFIKDIAKRVSSPTKSCTIKNIDTIFSYMQANNMEPVTIAKAFLLQNNPDSIISFLDLYCFDQLKDYADWRILFSRLEERQSDSKGRALYDGYIVCTHLLSSIEPTTRSLMVDIAGGYAKVEEDDHGNVYICDDNFTLSSQMSIFNKHIQDLPYIKDLLFNITEETKFDIFSLLKLDPKDVQEWNSVNK